MCGTPGVSNILHLGGIKPGTFSSPAAHESSVAWSQQGQLLPEEALLWTSQRQWQAALWRSVLST